MSTKRFHAGRGCSRCGSRKLISVSMNREDGQVAFWTCSMCEATGWERDGSQVSRSSALTHVPRR
jgi:transcription elongation factor Elf1